MVLASLRSYNLSPCLRPPSPSHVDSGSSFSGSRNPFAIKPDSITTIWILPIRYHVLVILDLENATNTSWNMYFMATFHSSVSSTTSMDPSTPKEVDVMHID
jgi:hypothetical protein